MDTDTPPAALVRVQMQGDVGIAMLDQPQRRNALSRQMVDELVAALGHFAQSRARAVILRAAPGSTGVVGRPRRA